MSPQDEAQAIFRQVREQYDLATDRDENEAEVRLRLVDRILFEVLSWPINAKLELRSSGGITDYCLRDEERRNWAIVEAKRAQQPLAQQIGPGKDGSTRFKLSGSALSFGKREGAWPIFQEQVASYAVQHGTSAAIVTNGHQWVGASFPTTDGKSLSEQKAVIFASLDDVDRGFELFYSYFSLDGMRRNNLKRFLLGPSLWSVRTSDSWDSVVPNATAIPAEGAEEEYYREISSALDIAFAPAEDHEEIVQRCFVESRESKDADDRLTRLMEILTESIQSTEVLELKVSEKVGVRSARAGKKGMGTLALLTGEVSAGKTTYLKKFFRFTLAAAMRRQVKVAHVEFDHTQAIDIAGLFRFAAESLASAVFGDNSVKQNQVTDLYSSYWAEHKGLYGNDRESKRTFIQEVRSRQREDPAEYMKVLMNYSVARHNRLPCLIFDGLDHLPIDRLEQVLNLAATLHRTTFAVVVAVLDDATVWKLRKERLAELMSRYVTLTVWLPRPKVGKVLDARLDYLKSIFDSSPTRGGRTASTVIGEKTPMRWTLKSEEVARFLRDGLLFGDSEVSDWFAMLANYNIRDLLRICRAFILSPAVKKEGVFKWFATGRGLDKRCVMTALIHPTHFNYRPHSSHWVHNIYSFRDDRRQVPLGPFLLLAFLEQRFLADSQENPESVRGFCTVGSVREFAEGTLYVPGRLADQILNWLVVTKLCQPYNPSAVPGREDLPPITRVKITWRGQLHLRWATQQPRYMREMGEVDEICDAELVRKMRDLKHKFSGNDWMHASIEFEANYAEYLSELFRRCNLDDHSHVREGLEKVVAKARPPRRNAWRTG